MIVKVLELLEIVSKIGEYVGIAIIVASLGRGLWYLITKYLDKRRR
jgi:hypothetical protein